MDRIIFLVSLLLLMTQTSYSQVGINTENPNATIDVVASKTDGTTAEGIIAPRLTLAQLNSKNAKYAAAQIGAIVYVSNITGGTTTKTAKVVSIGYYYFDGVLWQPFLSSVSTSSNPWYKVGTTAPSVLNTDNSYLQAKAVVGASTIASVNGGTNNAQLTVVGGDAFINGITVGRGKDNLTANTAIGAEALAAAKGASNTAVGHAALRTSTGTGNTALGAYAGSVLTTGANNTVLGANTGNTLTTGSNNIVIGSNTQVPSAAGDNQINIGNALHGTRGATAGTGAVSIGKTAPAAGVTLDVNGKMRYTDGTQQNGAILTSDGSGNASWKLASSSNPWYKVGTTTPSVLNTDNSYLQAKAVVGASTIASVNGGTNNAQLTVVGGDAFINGITVGRGKDNLTANTAVGAEALAAAKGTSNTAVGHAGLRTSTGTGNTALGAYAGSVLTTGVNNIVLGANTGNTLTTGSNNIVIGSNTQVPSAAGDNQINIGNALHGTRGATAGTGAVSIGKTAPAAGVALDVNGKMRYTDGTQQNGAILTSDGLGNASWKLLNVTKNPQVISPYGTSYTGTIENAATQAVGPKITIPANSTWMVFSSQLVRLERTLTGVEFLFVRLQWVGTGIQILGGRYMSAPLNVGMYYNVVSGLCVLKNPTASAVTCTLKVAPYDALSAQVNTNVKYYQLFGVWSENSLFMIPIND